ncbi:hypothetical protein Scep_023167 [Stephania cephalantha]|uniref:Uncharacterized protein n=1 Tax=Stephania cephalantha TaxID=152367 RepID=A0AAP0EZL2_9MAGN
MATVRWFLIVPMVLALICVAVRADSAVADEVFGSDSALKAELEQLKSKVSVLESSVEEKGREVKSKDESIAQLEKVIKEKSERKKGTVDAAEKVGKANAQARDLEQQTEKLKKEIEAQTLKKNALEARLYQAESKIQELNSKIQNLQKVNDDQKSRIRKTERALQVAEEEMTKAKLEATSKHKLWQEVHGAWFPPWFATHLAKCQSIIVTEWEEHGKPSLDVTVQKILEKKDQAQKWAEPHWENVKTKWIPTLKEQWVTFTTYMEPHVQLVTTKTIEVYESSKSALAPHVNKAQELADPYFQEAKKFTKPYIDHVATVTKPHVEKVQIALKPHTEKAVHVYREFLKSATTYHHQAQVKVQEMLNQYEFTRTLATKELVWFMASALLALPLIFLLRLCSTIFCKKAKKPARSANSHHGRRRPKRGHSDK